jgi:hypothetical protein
MARYENALVHGPLRSLLVTDGYHGEGGSMLLVFFSLIIDES